MKVGLTGASGFLGSHLTTHLKKCGHEVFSFEGDIANFNQINQFFKNQKFEAIIHLAGISNIADADSDIQKLFEVNILGTANLLQALTSNCPQAYFLFASTAQVYAPPTAKNKIREQDEIKPQNLYAQSKLMGERMVESYASTRNIKTTVLRIFNHTHKTQPDKAFLPVVYKQCLLAQEKGQNTVKLSLGNIDLERDISPVQNFTFLVEKLLTKASQVTNIKYFNVCSGEGVNLRQLILAFAEHMNLRIEIEIDSAKVRSGDPAYVAGDNSAIYNFLQIEKLKSSVESLIKGFHL
jgi:nucleoside-diphosphate-sugar epimerase